MIEQARNHKDRIWTGLRLPGELLKDLSEIALRENKSRVLLIQEILEDYVSRRSEDNKPHVKTRS